MVQNPLPMPRWCGRRGSPRVRKILEKGMVLPSSILLGDPMDRELDGDSPWGHRESGMAEHTLN